MRISAIIMFTLCFLAAATAVRGQSATVPHAVSATTGGTLYVAASTTDASGAPQLWLLSYHADGSRAGELRLPDAPDVLPRFLDAMTDTLIIGATALDGTNADFLALSVNPDLLVDAAPLPAPSAFAIEAGYPNPLSAGSALILYTLPYAAHVRLEVRSLSGATVETLVDEYTPAGRHRIVFTPRDLVSGTYYLILTSPEGVTLRKIVLLR
ncbi:MAG: T9SS type A sorting domain-containing protein [Pseudomonadota bacterium]